MVTNDAETQKTVGVDILTPQPMRPDMSMLSALAALSQRWAEQSEQASKHELTAELMWFFKGCAFAFGLNAQRIRSLADPGNAKKPPTGDLGLGQAFEIMVNMLQSMSVVIDQESVAGNGDEAAE